MRFARPALKVVMQNEGDFLDVILLYMPGNRMALQLVGNIEKYAGVERHDSSRETCRRSMYGTSFRGLSTYGIVRSTACSIMRI